MAQRNHDLSDPGVVSRIKDQHEARKQTKGEANGKARLTAEQVAEMKRLIRAGSHSVRALGRMFGVSATAVGHIKAGRTWGHVS